MRHYLKFDNSIRVRLIIISLQLHRDMAATAYAGMTAFETGIGHSRSRSVRISLTSASAFCLHSRWADINEHAKLTSKNLTENSLIRDEINITQKTCSSMK
ncbi:hypothetical protein BDR03DRAFT_948955 [Suillus americanus]|nr:hypothetical protein BDR03DRAFT_948955 [Suillus americanus]